jgi:hypothetical protein
MRKKVHIALWEWDGHPIFAEQLVYAVSDTTLQAELQKCVIDIEMD